ncbi:hypothetical protein QUF88_07450 [Bacillus sp. DX1.1]|uniref:hypothetical protein n=1 Tax=unclassified Bacillus (in: firmicutes) TaxID=185979 RepID=UPI00257108F4|nr:MULTISPECIES: hypothetical protein [unclassified Bacillus (in: firmicutes)]MDM5153667.1 hypothetical protein [Bacillus sp. DX1.1]WJE82608.1 hypothetical protein QRE67_04955 [Bacillus sp. DX3.1]
MAETSHMEIADRLTEYRIAYGDEHDRLASKYNWIQGKDIRLTGLSKIANSLDFARTGIYLGRSKYYKRVPEQKLLPDSNLATNEKNTVKKNILNEFHAGIKRGFFLSLHMSVESTIRVTAKGLGLEKDNFYETYKDLLNQLNPTKKDEFMRLLNVIRNVRNTIHNNGVYSNANKSISYGRSTYTFTKGARVPLRWADIDDFLEGTLEMLVTIAEHPSIHIQPVSNMEDPSA